jgi:hypothetical protein
LGNGGGLLGAYFKDLEYATEPWRKYWRKLEKCRQESLYWQQAKRGPTTENIRRWREKLNKAQEGETVGSEHEEKMAKQRLQLLLDQENLKWKQRAKADWLQGGDRNTKYYHACANYRKKSNQIFSIVDELGVLRDSDAAVKEAFVNYFSDLFTAGPAGDPRSCLEHLEEKVSTSMNMELLKPFSTEEVDSALHQMAPLKAPGPDGFPAGFFQHHWAVMGKEVGRFIIDILNSGSMPPQLNMTHIALIPKVKSPTCVTEFRPISLCNVVYKLISKVLANRLKKVLPHIISPSQSAFIPGRLITDNILAAYETLHTMHSRMGGKKSFMAVKLDMSKAYDRVEWSFLEETMKRLGFADRWRQLIMMCVTTTQYAVVVNGEPCGNILPTRGLRQGDPISPYLFLLCAEALSSMLSWANREGALTGVPTSKRGPHIGHLFFADDSLLFCRANIQQWNCLSSILKKYEKASGQRLNSNKTTLFFSRNTTMEDKKCLGEIVGIPSSQSYDKYLGLPALVGKSRIAAFRSIVNRIWKRLQDWKLKFLSQAGKEILIKAVIQAIPSYCMSVFLLPKTLCEEINKLMQKFWWSHFNKDSNVHWMSWKRMGVAKKMGGMGFRDLHAFNMALLAKQCWRLWKTPDSLIAKIMKAKYYPEGSILTASIGSNPSFAWRSIHGSCGLLNEGLIWRVRNGKKIRIWQERWLPNAVTYKVMSPPTVLNPSATVSELIKEDTGWWDSELLNRIFIPEEVDLIQAMPISSTNQDDILVWRGAKTGLFSVRSAYYIQLELEKRYTAASSNNTGTSKIWTSLWALKIPNVEKKFIWKACHDILPTKANLCKRKIIDDPLCPLCESETETVLTHFGSALRRWTHGVWDAPDSRRKVSTQGKIFYKWWKRFFCSVIWRRQSSSWVSQEDYG